MKQKNDITRPTEHFTILEPQDPQINISELVKIHQSMFLEARKQRAVYSGKRER